MIALETLIKLLWTRSVLFGFVILSFGRLLQIQLAMSFRPVLGFLTISYVLGDAEISMQRDFRYPTVNKFDVYWNVPSFMCQKYGINFAENTKRWGIVANEGDAFRGEKMIILYDPGAFPAVLKSSKGKLVERNGGVPQLGNLTWHLDMMTRVVDQLIPKNYSSLAVIDFEAYRPIFRQNWNEQEIYTNMSKEEIRQKHPQWDESVVSKVAKQRFERGARVFMETTLNLCKTLRPKAQWGYYGFPYCYNYRTSSGMVPWCHKDTQKENNQIQWLFDASDALYLSLYMSNKMKVNPWRFVLGRMNEASRLAFRVAPEPIPEIYPYMWYKYQDSLDFLSEYDLYNAMEAVRRYKMGGFIVWGASNDFTSKEKCQTVMRYLNTVLGPTVVRVKSNAKRPSRMEDEEDQRTNEDKIVLHSNEEPKVVIYSAVGPEGTKTIYEYEKPSLHYNVVTEKPIPRTTTERNVRSAEGKPTIETPWLREYMKGFNLVLNMIMKRWLK